ncbi:MAG: hypothetical protein WBW38_21675 [Candidatus Sulfotelmatobacter sp.]
MKKAKGEATRKAKTRKAAVKSNTGKVAAKKAAGEKTIGKKTPGDNIPVKVLKPVDFVEVRKSIAALVGGAAREITEKAIEEAKQGQLGPAKYLFEAVGLYPPTEETAQTRPEDSLAYTLLRRMGLPTDPVIRDEDDEVPVVTREKKGTSDEPVTGRDEELSWLRQNEEQGDAVK